MAQNLAVERVGDGSTSEYVAVGGMQGYRLPGSFSKWLRGGHTSWELPEAREENASGVWLTRGHAWPPTDAWTAPRIALHAPLSFGTHQPSPSPPVCASVRQCSRQTVSNACRGEQ